MRCIFFILILCISARLYALPNCCTEPQLRHIRYVASDAIEKADISGGDLFRKSVVFTPYEAAWANVEHKKCYSEFSAVFRRFISYCEPPGLPYLYYGFGEVGALFNDIYSTCIANTNDCMALYERGRIYFDHGLYEECLSDLHKISDLGKLNDLSQEIALNDLLYIQGLSHLESNEYDDAIRSLTDLIDKNPTHKDAYFGRAVAFFEQGNFDEALNDFRLSEKSKALQKIVSRVSHSFSQGLLQGLNEGGIEALADFFPSLWYSAYGIGNAIWVFTENPISCSNYYANACYDAGVAIVDYLKTVDGEKIDGYVAEVQALYHGFDALKDSEKGRLIGQIIGKYGTDIVATGGAMKCISSLQKLREANRIRNLEALSSPKAKEALTASAARHHELRGEYFRNVKYNYDSHNKHVLGHNDYDGKRSIFTHKDPEYLLRKYAGKGKPRRGVAGDYGFKEEIDFGEIIGVWKNEAGTLSSETTRGAVHYGKKGAHIVPIKPITN